MLKQNYYITFLIIYIIFALTGCTLNGAKYKNQEMPVETINKTDDTYDYTIKDENSAIHKILKQWQDGINSKDVEKYLSVFDNNMRDITELNIKTAKDDEKKDIRFYAVKKLKYGNVKKVSLDDIHYYDTTIFNLDSAEVYYFYFDAELYDNMETKYTKNGVNFAFCILTKQGDDWKISQLSDADVASFILKGIDLGTSEEAELKTKLKKY